MRKRLAATIGATLALSVVQASVIGAPARPIARPSPLTAMGQCLNTSSSTWHRFDLKKINGLWYARVFLDSTNQLLYSAEYNPPILWSIAESQHASEVLNGGKDQSGGLSASRLTFDAARWYTSTGTIVWADMQGSERVCILCPPYHSQWYDGNTFEVWTDAST
jgi:hypothetical protein